MMVLNDEMGIDRRWRCFNMEKEFAALGTGLACVKEDVLWVGGGRRWIIKLLRLLLMVLTMHFTLGDLSYERPFLSFFSNFLNH